MSCAEESVVTRLDALDVQVAQIQSKVSGIARTQKDVRTELQEVKGKSVMCACGDACVAICRSLQFPNFVRRRLHDQAVTVTSHRGLQGQSNHQQTSSQPLLAGKSSCEPAKSNISVCAEPWAIVHTEPHEDSGYIGEEPQEEHGYIEEYNCSTCSKADKITALVVGLIGALILLIMCSLSSGMMKEDRRTYAISTMSRPGFIDGTFHSTPVDIVLHGTGTKYFEVRIVAGGHGAGDFALDNTMDAFAYSLLVDGKAFFNKTIDSKNTGTSFEEFQGVNLINLGADNGSEYKLRVTCDRSNGSPCVFAAQVVQMGSWGAWRELVGLAILVITWTGIICEHVHRVYFAMFGVVAGVLAINSIQETFSFEAIFATIDFGVIMVLFSQMILTNMLSETGFFSWFIVKLVRFSGGEPQMLLLAFCGACGVLGIFVDPVTAVMTVGPATYGIASAMNLNPRYVYLPATICSSIGSTASFMGQTSNLIICSKLKIGFHTFLTHNFPIIVFVSLPIASSFLYWKIKDRLQVRSSTGREQLELDLLLKQNPITDVPKFLKLVGIYSAVLVGLLLTPIHDVQPACYILMAVFAGALLFQPHSIHHYLMAVEWDTLIFNALLFCLAGSMSRLGVIKMISIHVRDVIMFFPEVLRTSVAVIATLWTSALGSAFIESMPFTCLMIYILLDMKEQETRGFDPVVLAWPLSVGVCVGGVGSIMGSSANLVSMAVSSRQAGSWDEKISGSDFLEHGFPTMVVIIFICMLWQILLFGVLGIPAY